MSTLENAIALAAHAHAGQTDKTGGPMIFHPLRVLLAVSSDAPPAARTAAVLHDVVENTAWILERRRAEGFDEDVLGAVDALTRRDGEEYADQDQQRLEKYRKALEILDAEEGAL